MRIDRLIIPALMCFVFGCQTQTIQTQQVKRSYYEDLSVHRPVLESQEINYQNTSSKVAVPSGHIKTKLDTALAKLKAEHIKVRTVQGYTVQLFRGNNRDEATEILGKFRSAFPDDEADIVYFQPDFRVNAGNFQSRLAAYEFLGKIRKKFPNSLMIPHRFKINEDD